MSLVPTHEVADRHDDLAGPASCHCLHFACNSHQQDKPPCLWKSPLLFPMQKDTTVSHVLLLQMPDVKTWHNTRIFGKKKAMVENSGMMAVLTTESFTPIIEVDILGPDSHELLGLSEDRFQQMSIGMAL